MPDELKPCPYCGNRAEYWNGDPDGSQGVFVFCEECGLRGPLTMDMTKAAAVAAWNALPRRELSTELETASAKTIRTLRKREQAANKEADWLAGQLAALSGRSVVYWRKLAFRAVGE